MKPQLPEPNLFRQNCHHEDGWTDHYGSLQTAFAYAGRSMPARYKVRGLWQHGCLGPWEAVTPGALVFNAPGAQERPVFVARREEADFLHANGYPHARAIGVPILYAPPSGLARVPRSLLIMPTHTLVGDKFPDRSDFVRYADEMKELAADFDQVTVCIHPSCKRNGLWVSEFAERGFTMVLGAQTNDANALRRMRALFDQYDTVTTNGWGSHVAYALAFGAKVALIGTKPAYDKTYLLRDLTWSSDVRSLELTLADECQRQQQEFLRDFRVPPNAAVGNRELGEWLLGRRHRLAPAEMSAMLDELVKDVPAPIVAVRSRPLLFVAPGPAPDGAAEELLRMLGWLRRESRQGFAVLLDESHPLRAHFAALAPVHTAAELAAAPALRQSFEAIYAGGTACSELIEEATATDVPVLTRATVAGINHGRLAARRLALSLRQSGHFLADNAAAADRLQRVFQVPPDRITVLAEVTTEEQALALWAEVHRLVQLRPVSPKRNASLAGLYAGWLPAEMPEAAYVRAHLARAEARGQAREHIEAGRKREGVQALVGAVGRDLATKDPLIIIESLCEIGADLAPMDGRQAGALLEKAKEIARSIPLKTESFCRTAPLAPEISTAA